MINPDLQYLSEKDIQTAHRRRPKSGKTLFHENLAKSNILNLTEWAVSNRAPINKVDRKGHHPFIAYLSFRANHTRRLKEEIGEAPGWWSAISNSGQDGWVKRAQQNLEREQEIIRRLDERFASEIDWPNIDENFKHQIRKNLPSNLDLTNEGAFIDRLIDKGLRLSPFTHQNMTMTMAMWSLCKSSRISNASYWLEREGPDPTDDGPGFLSVLFACWDTHNHYKEEMGRLCKQAINLGASHKRPTIQHNPIKKHSMEAFEEIVFSSEAPTRKTLLGQAESIGNGEAIALLLGIDDISEHEGLEIFEAAILNAPTPNIISGYRSSPDALIAYLDSLLEKLPKSIKTSNHNSARRAKSHLITDLASCISFESHRIMQDLFSETMDPRNKVPLATSDLTRGLTIACENLKKRQLVSWLDLVSTYGETSTTENINDRLLKILVYRLGRVDRIKETDNIFHGLNYLLPRSTKKQKDECLIQFFKSSTLGNLYTKEAVDRFIKHGAQLSSSLWANLLTRVDTTSSTLLENQHDSIATLAQYLGDSEVLPDKATILDFAKTPIQAISDTTDNWTSRPFEEIRLLFFDETLKILARGDESGLETQKTLEALLERMDDAWKSNDFSEMQVTMVERLIAVGGDPSATPPQKSFQDHPYWKIMAKYDHTNMEQETASAKSSPRKPGRL